MKKLDRILRLGTKAWAYIIPDDDEEVATVTMLVDPDAKPRLEQRQLADGRVSLYICCPLLTKQDATLQAQKPEQTVNPD